MCIFTIVKNFHKKILFYKSKCETLANKNLKKKEKIQNLEEIINEKIQKSELITFGTSILPNESGIIVKILGNNTENIFEKIYDIVKITRKEILNAEFTKLRKN